MAERFVARAIYQRHYRFRLRLRLLPFFRFTSNGPKMTQATVTAPRRITAPKTITVSIAANSAVPVFIVCPFFLWAQWPATVCAGAG